MNITHRCTHRETCDLRNYIEISHIPRRERWKRLISLCHKSDITSEQKKKFFFCLYHRLLVQSSSSSSSSGQYSATSEIKRKLEKVWRTIRFFFPSSPNRVADVEKTISLCKHGLGRLLKSVHRRLTSGIDHYQTDEWMIILYYIHCVAASLTLGWWLQVAFKEGVRSRRRPLGLSLSVHPVSSISFSHKTTASVCTEAHRFSLIWQGAALAAATVDFQQGSVCSHHGTSFFLSYLGWHSRDRSLLQGRTNWLG